MASNNGSDGEVFGNLPSSRPQRRSAKRDRAKAAATKPKAAEPKAAKASAPRAQTAKAPAAKRTTPRKPAPVPPAGYATPRADDDRPGNVDLLATAFQAVGELAQIGIAAGGRALKSVVDRVPRP